MTLTNNQPLKIDANRTFANPNYKPNAPAFINYSPPSPVPERFSFLRNHSSLQDQVVSTFRSLICPKLSEAILFGNRWSFIMGAVEKPLKNKEDRLPGEAKEILKSLAAKWGDVVDTSELQVFSLKGAMTNQVFQIKWPTETKDVSRKVLVRIYGQGVEVFFDRDDEIRTFEFISKHGQGPRLLGRFSNGRIEEFINARTLSASDLRDPKTSALIASKMKEFHDLEMPGPKNVRLWERLRKWLHAAKSLASPEEAKAFCLDTIEEDISILEKELSQAHQHIVFCHNDLQYGNIMIDEKTNSITIIDYEYASYNPVAFDIANHFCEMAADYHTETPHILDFSKYPGLEERQRFVRIYLSSSGNEPSNVEVEQLLQDVEKYTLANHLFWGLWGIISEHVNEIDFDYIEYARQRFQQYWSRKPTLLGSVGASPDSATDGNRAI
ncbi:probable choline kinase 2 isoform X1 [Alnus glutinosa]|uniref:probable choline kinase 2 isoform X1 n=2 Tax=Alnus glutinosa TaxID=3517 RepID=UPI002D792B28|nr:probable choline kinase 2 isoform X1 [Alnus glutinosa]